MKSEIRGLKAGRYYGDDDILLDVFRADDGIHIAQADFDLGIFSEWIINENGRVVLQYMDVMHTEDEGDEFDEYS
tara:strand:- start:794 stop:1018 length:225 start_codon:yes stop_codon:yes gene_type:complete